MLCKAVLRHCSPMASTWHDNVLVAVQGLPSFLFCPHRHHALLAGKSRGYAFIEFEHKADMKEAYKRGDGRKIEGKRVVVDVERGRTTQGW